MIKVILVSPVGELYQQDIDRLSNEGMIIVGQVVVGHDQYESSSKQDRYVERVERIQRENSPRMPVVVARAEERGYQYDMVYRIHNLLKKKLCANNECYELKYGELTKLN